MTEEAGKTLNDENANLLRFLLVEDDDAHAKIITRTFQSERIGNIILRVRDGEEALSVLRQTGPHESTKAPDIILLDLKLPKIDGFEVLREIRKDSLFAHIPVVILTTSESETDKAKAYGLHANSYLVKPADAAAFRQMVRDLNLYWGVWNQPARSKLNSRSQS